MNANRLKTRKEFWIFVVKMAYMLLGLPFLLLIGLVMVLTMPQSSSRVPGDVAGTVIIWMAILIPISFFIFNVFKKRRFLRSVVNTLRSDQQFNPDASLEMYHEGDGKYLGIDINNGTILYIHRIRKGQVDVLGLSMGDWTNREVEGNMFRLYTKIPQLPRIEISTPWAQRWFDTLGAMEHKRYDTPQPFKAYVNDHIHLLEHENKIHIPKLA